MKTSFPRIDWKTERDRVDLAAVATRWLGPAPGRRGERGRKLWWVCPFHGDRNPSFCVDPGKPWWKCYGCGESGDAATLVMKLGGKSFPEAVAELTGRANPTSRPAARPVKAPVAKPPPEPSGLPVADALALVESSVARLWSPEGRDALDHLTGPRCLTPETILAARLGWTPGTSVPTRDGDRSFRAVGIVVPWFAEEGLALVKIRQPDDRRPKYAEAFRRPDRVVCYPDHRFVRPGRPLVAVEGELDALVLGQELGDLAAVVTLGSASADPIPEIRRRFHSAFPWFVAHDADEPGDKAAARWPSHSIRVRPPAPWKDWGEAKTHRVNLRRWWSDILAGEPRPPLHTWDDLTAWRWGPAVGDPAPGLIVPRTFGGLQVP